LSARRRKLNGSRELAPAIAAHRLALSYNRNTLTGVDHITTMSEQLYIVKWECISCGQEHSFRYTLPEHGEWPNKFELECGNQDCRQEQDVPFRRCEVELFTLSSEAEA